MTITNYERIVILREMIEVFEVRIALAAKEHRELQRLLVEKRRELADLEAMTSRKVSA
jgi:hypothetical protein